MLTAVPEPAAAARWNPFFCISVDERSLAVFRMSLEQLPGRTCRNEAVGRGEVMRVFPTCCEAGQACLVRRRHHAFSVHLGTATCGPSRTRRLQPMG